MLTKQDNELLCRVGPGTPMGRMMREYWVPALLSEEMPDPDGAPVRVRLLGEDLIAWRNTDNSVGLMQNACPHRGASMFFGRNEENGLRCVYHGWKFDVDGNCVEQMNEPEPFAHKVHVTAYPTVERGGLVCGWRCRGVERLYFDAERFAAYPGGAELNTCHALASLGLRCAWFSLLPEGPLGRRVLRHLRAGGVDVSLVRTRPGRHTASSSMPRASRSARRFCHMARLVSFSRVALI